MLECPDLTELLKCLLQARHYHYQNNTCINYREVDTLAQRAVSLLQ